MNQDDIFLKASEITDSAERAAYVNDVCAGNAELEQRVTALLKADEEASRFLDMPAMSDVRAQVRELRETSKLIELVDEGRREAYVGLLA